MFRKTVRMCQMCIRKGGPLNRNGEWRILNGKLFNVPAINSTDKKKNTLARIKLKVVFIIKLLS